jgi:hypothetical protein
VIAARASLSTRFVVLGQSFAAIAKTRRIVMDRKTFLNRLATLAKVCEFPLNQDLVALYDRSLRKFGYEAASKAVEDAIIERRGFEKMPSIGDLVHRCSPQILDQDSAVEVAGRVLSGISRFGYNNPLDAERFIGAVGWYVVSLNGGWRTLCETVKEKDLPQWKAQLREQAGAALRRYKAGVLGTAPTFGEVSKPVASLVGDIIRKTDHGSTGNDRALSPDGGLKQFRAQGSP